VLEDAGASGIVITPAGEGRVEVEAEVEENAKDRIFYAFAEAKLPIREMRTEKMSLEEIFLRYTSSGEGEGHGGDL